MWPLKLFIVMTIVMLVTGCATEEQKQKAFEKRLKTYYGPECMKSLGFIEGQAGTEEERTNLKWCISRLIAIDRLNNGEDDPQLKLIAYWIPNCEAILGTDWGAVGSEKRSKLAMCIDMQAKQDIEMHNREEQMMILQGLINNSRTQERVINCYSYGNWTQCN